jgi:hypothetical protein
MTRASNSSSGRDAGAGAELYRVGGGEQLAMVVCRSLINDSGVDELAW